MFKGQKIVVVMPAYNAEKTLRKTYREVMDQQIVDEVIVVDDAIVPECYQRTTPLEWARSVAPRDRRPDDRSLTSVSVQGKSLLQNRGGERAPTRVGGIPPVSLAEMRPE